MKWSLPAAALFSLAVIAAPEKPKLFLDDIGMDVPHVSADKGVKLDYPIVYVRAPRKNPDGRSRWAEVGDPRTMEPGSDLMLLHPDGKEEVLVEAGPRGAVADPFVSFDGQSVYYARMHDALGHKGADIYRVHVASKKITRLTDQTFTPNTGAADWSKTPLPSWGVYNLGPCPLPGGRVAFVSDRNAYRAANPGYAPNALALQLFVMDEDGRNVECIGHLNLGMALHPVILKDGRIMFSSLESQGLRSHHLWGVWTIHPDGSNWGPLVSAFEIGNGTADSTHFQTQLSDESVVVESYYNLNNFGFGTYYKLPPRAPDGVPAFGPGYKPDARNARLRHGRHADGRPIHIQYPFSPHGIEALTPFVLKGDWPSEPSVRGKNDSPRVGKFTHPSGAPDNHLLTAWSAGSINSHTRHKPPFDSGIYLIKGGRPIDEPAQMRLVKNDPRYHEQWPRALVPYERIYGVKEPKNLVPLKNDGKASKHLPAGTPFGLVGSSSLYKRESYPYGVVKPGSVTAAYAGEKDPTGRRGFDSSHGWSVQGSDAGLYDNSEIHSVRILLLEPTSEARQGRTYYNHARERMRILGEVPVRKTVGGKAVLDPDGNPDTSFLAKIPADVAWTFQTLDKDGMVLNSAQTWHQLRPGEVRTDCGGCHAHSQKPTLFKDTWAGKEGFTPADLTRKQPATVEYHRDIVPILERSCVACHSHKQGGAGGEPKATPDKAVKPAGNLVLDEDGKTVKAQNPAGLGFEMTLPSAYARLCADRAGKFGHRPLHRHGWTDLSASRYVRLMQSRRSLLVWKLFGKRLDGFSDADVAHETTPGDVKTLVYKGKPAADTAQTRERSGIAYTGGIMPPPEAVKSGKVKALSDEDRRTIIRWIDLGCPIDLKPVGWGLDESRPTLALTGVRPGVNPPISRLLIGMHDCGTGLDVKSLRVTADFAIGDAKAGEDLASKFKAGDDGVWAWDLPAPLKGLKRGTLTVSVKDKQGNTTRIDRTFSVTPTR